MEKLPDVVISKDGKSASVGWEPAQAVDILQDARFGPVSQEGGVVLMLYFKR